MVTQGVFIVDGLDHYFARSGSVGTGGNSEFGENIGFSLEQSVDVVHVGGGATVNGCDVVAWLDVHARFGEWRAQFVAVGAAG